MSRPAKLQINQRGAWRDVMRFDVDAIDNNSMYLFLNAAAEMVRTAGQAGTTMRIVSDEAAPKRVLSWTSECGWKSNGNTACLAPNQSQRVPAHGVGVSGSVAPGNASTAPKQKGA